MSVKLLTEHRLEFVSVKGGYTGSSESTLVKMHRVAAQFMIYWLRADAYDMLGTFISQRKGTRKSITCYYMLYKGVATCYLNLLVISSCCFDTNSEMFLMIHLYQIAQLTTNDHYIFKQLSESVAKIMSQKMFLKTP